VVLTFSIFNSPWWKEEESSRRRIRH